MVNKMAKPTKVGAKWLARIRRKGYPEQSAVFSTKILAEKWQRGIEAQIDQQRAGVVPTGAGYTVGDLVQRYIDEIGRDKPFGRNKADVLSKLVYWLKPVQINDLTAERIVEYIRDERRIHGVTAAIDLTYLKAVLKVARALWRIPVRTDVVDDAREMLRYMGAGQRSMERDRRPTQAEIDGIRGWLAAHSTALTPDHVDFTLESCFRPPSEITRLRWSDLNRADRTILITDRKDPKKKLGNNQIVPLLGRCMEIIDRQPMTEDFIFPVKGKTWSSIFPRACHALGIKDLRLYDLRHEAISRLVEAGRHTIPEMMLVTGHKNPQQLMRYTQLRARDLHRE